MASMYQKMLMILEAQAEIEELLYHVEDVETAFDLSMRLSVYSLLEAQLFASASKADIQACVKDILLSQLRACGEEECITPQQAQAYASTAYVRRLAWFVTMRQRDLRFVWEHRN